MAAEESNATMALLEQMLGRKARTAAVVETEKIPARAFELAIEYEQRGVRAYRMGDPRSVTAFGRRKNDRCGLMLHQRAEHGLLTRSRLAGAAKQGYVTRCGQRLVDAGGELGEERVGQVVDHERYARGSLAAQIRCGPVVDVAELAHMRLHPRARVRVHERAVAQHQRHGCARHPRRLRDVVEGDPTAPTVAHALMPLERFKFLILPE